MVLQMNKEAIERTKARCKKISKDEIDVTTQTYLMKEMLERNQQLFNQFRNPKEASLLYAPYPNIWTPESRKEVLLAILVTVLASIIITCGIVP